MARQIFVSHTKKDVKFCDELDRVCSRVGIKAFRSEFEEIKPPAWGTIKDAMDQSVAMFLLIGAELIKAQEAKAPDWAYVQNWIAYEIGLACERRLDVWVVCDDVEINFPVPYFNHYFPFNFRDSPNFGVMRGFLQVYHSKGVFVPPPEKKTYCPYEDCRINFNLHVVLPPDSKIKCPQCLRNIVYPKGFLQKE